MNEIKLFKKAESLQTCKPGEWCKDSEGRVYIRCPHKHGRVGMLTGHLEPGKDWNISDDGRVTPSVFFVDPECNYHEYITLLDWKK